MAAMDSIRPMVAFDAMGVIFLDSDDVSSRLVPFLRERGVTAPEGEVVAAYRRASLGEMSARGFWEAWGLGPGYPSVQDAYLKERILIDPGFRAAASAMGAWADLGLLSNDVGEWSAALRAMHGLDGIFSLTVVSGDVGERKPSRRIYEFYIERSLRPAGEILFIDDRPLNLSVAAELGMRTLHFRRESPLSLSPAPGTSPLPGFMPDATAASMEELPSAARRALLRSPSP
jgi:FMN phosphatase YigB (HAD superfamily)